MTTLVARDRHGPDITFQALLSPSTDLTRSSPSILENAHAPILTKADMDGYARHYRADVHHPYASPLLAEDHARLPAALVQVAEHDPLRDDGLRYSRALRASGVPVRATTHVGGTHGYFAFPHFNAVAPQALSELTTEIRAALHPEDIPAGPG
ncbi:hypothetical protein GCM10009755_05100 [Brevibacterium samyangense]|uniref:Alpha/beta hydrolase fold-3 domain-containing protein n=1 Tax=Brevibacterium samyangense TaxID=366888 RepID=A0ABN2T6V0_9MICO